MIRFPVFALLSLLVCGCSFDETFFPIDEGPDDKVVTSREDIVLKATDGKKIHHMLLKPQSDSKATIFVFQGSGSTAANWVRLLTPLLDNGYQVFLMEYRGFGKSEGKARHEAVVSDAYRAISFLANRTDVRNKKLLLLGQSYGGQLAINVAAKFPEQIDALVIEGAFTSFKDIAVHSAQWFVRPFVWMIFANPYDATRLIRRTSIPVLVIHSREDSVVPLYMGEELYRLARAPKEFWLIDGDHVDVLNDYPEEFIRRVDTLLGLNQANHAGRQRDH